ncbi:MAG: hypothetical protein K2Q25_06345, partial [Mycobacteriaceae bacterium]|nr:hypothetical protein [Mycobacteriaceae bacterium]
MTNSGYEPVEMSEAELNALSDFYRDLTERNVRAMARLSQPANYVPGRSGQVHPLSIAEEGGENELNELDEPLAQQPEPAGESRPWCRPSAIIVTALVLMVVFQQLTGWSAPFGFSGLPSSWRRKEAPPKAERGDVWVGDSQDFADMSALLQLAHPQTWSGQASGDYADATATLMALAQQMVELDQQSHGVVQAQADVVEETRFILGIEQDFLIVMFAVVLGLEQSCGTAMYTWLWWFAFGVAVSTVAAGVGELISCSERSRQHADHANSIRYQEVTAAALQVISACPPVLPRSAPAVHRREFTTFIDLVDSAATGSVISAASTGGTSGRAGQRFGVAAALGNRVGRQAARAAAEEATGAGGSAQHPATLSAVLTGVD